MRQGKVPLLGHTATFIYPSSLQDKRLAIALDVCPIPKRKAEAGCQKNQTASNDAAKWMD